MYAVIETGGKQYQVNEGDVLFIEKLAAEADETVTFDKVTVQQFLLRSSRTARLRRLLFSLTSLRRARRRSRVTDSLTLR